MNPRSAERIPETELTDTLFESPEAKILIIGSATERIEPAPAPAEFGPDSVVTQNPGTDLPMAEPIDFFASELPDMAEFASFESEAGDIQPQPAPSARPARSRRTDASMAPPVENIAIQYELVA
jgi:hypothetical protein